MERLNWDDLMIQDITPEQFRQWLLEPWSGIVQGRVAPAFLNKFGDWFLHRPEGHVEKLDIYSGAIERVADNSEELTRCVNDPEWQEDHLFTEIVYQLHQADKRPGPDQCYVFVPPPAFAGFPIEDGIVDAKRVMVVEISVAQTLAAQFARGDQSAENNSGDQ